MLAFIHIHKTAGTTLYHILRQSFGARHCDIKLWPPDGTDHWDVPKRVLTAEDLRRTRRLFWGLKSIRGHRVVGYSDLHDSYPDIRYFTIVREPLARTASYFQFIKKNQRMAHRNPLTFEEWISKPINHDEQCVMICGQPNADKAIAMIKERVNFVGLQERFDETLILLKHWAMPYKLDIRYQSRNVAKEDATIKKNLLADERTRELLTQANLEDLKLYRFVKEEWFPRLISEFDHDLTAELKDFQRKNVDFRPGMLNPFMSRIMRIGLYRPLLRYLSNGKVMN